MNNYYLWYCYYFLNIQPSSKSKDIIDLLSDSDSVDVSQNDNENDSSSEYIPSNKLNNSSDAYYTPTRYHDDDDYYSQHHYQNHTDYFDALSVASYAYVTPYTTPTKLRRVINTETSTDKSASSSAVTTQTLIDINNTPLISRKAKNSSTYHSPMEVISRNSYDREGEFYELFFEIYGVDIDDNEKDIPVEICVDEALNAYYGNIIP